MKDTAHAAKAMGADMVTFFTGSCIWKYWYSFPQTSEEMVEQGYQKAKEIWSPIMDEFDACGVKLALEIHPAEMAFDYWSAKRLLDTFDRRPTLGINLDPSHLVWQGIDPQVMILDFADRIYHVHVKDVKKNLNSRNGVLGSHITFGNQRRGWNFVSPGHGDVDFDNGAELGEIYRYVKEQGLITRLDLAAVDPNSKAGQADWQRILERVMPWVDIFVPSIEELCWMLDRDTYVKWVERAHGDDIVKVLHPEQDVKPLADRCLSMGAKVLLLKCGALGLYYATADATRLQALSEALGLDLADWEKRSGFECSYRPRRVLSATGAGDTTIAAFLAAMLSGYDFEMCIHLAAAEGASCVEAYGGISAVQPLPKLAQRIRTSWEKYPAPQ